MSSIFTIDSVIKFMFQTESLSSLIVPATKHAKLVRNKNNKNNFISNSGFYDNTLVRPSYELPLNGSLHYLKKRKRSLETNNDAMSF